MVNIVVYSDGRTRPSSIKTTKTTTTTAGAVQSLARGLMGAPP